MKKFIFLIYFLLIFYFFQIVSAQQISISLGPEEVVFNWTTQRCADDDIPDMSARAFKDINGNIQLIDSHYTNRRFIGSSLNTLNHPCEIILNSDLNPDPSQYNDHEWLASTYTLDGQTIYGLVHNEYHGHIYPPSSAPSTCIDYPSCWYNAITSAVSTDSGLTYTQNSAPNHLIASIPYPYTGNANNGMPYGYFNPSNIIQKDGYYYAFLQVEPYQNVQTWGSCPMRTQNLADPTSWRFWDGTGFNNVPIHPYFASVVNPANHLCQVVSQSNLQKYANSLTYNYYLGKYIMTGVWNNLASPGSGFYFSLSSDLINWEPPQFLMSATMPWIASIGSEWQGYPVLLEETNSMNFEITGQTPYLYYTKKNPNNLQLDRDLIRRQVTFTVGPSQTLVNPLLNSPSSLLVTLI